MKSQIIIGKAGKRNLSFDLETLLRTRLLVQAASGQGKSHLLRRLCEQLFGKVQIFFIDHEGEFATLRTDYAFTLIGEGGEAMPDVRTAGLLAHRLLELNVSAVFDLSESFRAHPRERRAWVRAFLSAMMEAPRRLWHPVAVIVDEAHKYCPEKDEAESSEAMTSVATDGRKRQFCAIWATQRLAKLNKDAAAELLNKMIGGTTLDIDRKRAADDLGVYGKDLQPFHDEIKVLERGYFWALGPAVAKTRTLVHIGETITRPPKMGKHASAPPPAPEKIKALLPQLADLPQELRHKEETEAGYKREIRDLKTKLAATERQSSSIKPAAVAAAAKADPRQARTIQQLRAALQEAVKFMAKVESFDLQAVAVDRQQVEAAVKSLVDRLLALSAQASAVPQKRFEQLRREAKPMIDKLQRLLDVPVDVKSIHVQAASVSAQSASRPPVPATSSIRTVIQPNEDAGGSLGPTNRKIAAILAAYFPAAIDKVLLASMCGKTLGGGWNGRLSETRMAGLLEDVDKNQVRATEECVRTFGGQWNAPTTTEEAIAVWDFKLSETHRAILNRLIEASGEPVSKADLAEAAGKNLGGGFNGRLSELRSTGLMLDAGKGFFKANLKALFLEPAERMAG
jgi:hypothetical protein